jgi:competence protein ComEC
MTPISMGNDYHIDRPSSFNARPALRIVLAYCMGLLIQSTFAIQIYIVWITLLIGLATYWVGHLWLTKRPSPLVSAFQMVVYVCVIILFGMQRYGGVSHEGSEDGRMAWDVATLTGNPLLTNALVYQVRTRSTGSTVWIRSDSLFFESRLVHKSPIELLLTWNADAPPPQINDRISAIIRLREPSGARNPFEFDYKEWLVGQGIRFQGNVDSVLHSEPYMGRSGWLPIRGKIDHLIRSSFDDAQVPIAKALLLGQKGDVETSDRQAFARSGLSHLMAVSGLHVGFIVMPMWLLIPFIWSYRMGRHLGFGFMTFVLVAYCGITGFPASVVRASVMALLVAFARIYRHPREPINLMALAALIILVVDPKSLWNTGFQLSFSAVTILLTVLPSLQRMLPERLNHKPWSILTGLILVSVVVQVGLYPILASEFGEYSIAGTLTNMAGIPLTQVLLLWSLVGLPLSALFPDSATIVMWPADLAASLLMVVASTAGAWDWSWWYVAKPNVMIYPIWFAGAMLISGIQGRNRWKLFILFMVCLLAWSISSTIDTRSKPFVEVLYFDVGQGDAALIRTQDGSNWLVDTGVFSLGYESGNRTILPVLRRLGINRLNGVVLSHPHADHIGGTLSIIESLRIDTLYEADFPTQSTLVAGYRSAARRNNVPIVRVQNGRELNIGTGVRARIIGPIEPEYHSDPNTASVVLKLEAGTISFLFTGDADEKAEMLILDRYAPMLASTVLKAGHHGSRTSSSSPFLRAVAPSHIVVSLALQNRYNHPHVDAIERLRSTGAHMHYTSLKSAIWMATDGHSVWEVPWK